MKPKAITIDLKFNLNQFNTMIRGFANLAIHNQDCSGCQDQKEIDIENIKEILKQASEQSDWVKIHGFSGLENFNEGMN